MNLSTRLFIYKKIAITLCFVLLAQLFAPTISYALTSGPSQPEVQSFEPVTTTEMVDLFTGDFNYNIPLFEVPGPNGGYPINLLYNAGINMDQEASWVGLGWNLNPGAITRSMQGLPDEYNGNSSVKSEYDMKPNVTISSGLGIGGIEIFGGNLLNASLGMEARYNNYRGFNTTFRAGLSLANELTESGKMSGTLDLNLSLDSETGLGVVLSPGIKRENTETGNYSSFYVGVGYNQASGLSGITFGGSIGKKGLVKDKHGDIKKINNGISGSSTLTMNAPGYLPRTTNQMETRFGTVKLKIGFQEGGFFSSMNMHGTISSTYVNETSKNINGYGYINAHNATDPYDMLDFMREQDGMIHKNTPNLAIPIATPDLFSMTSHGMSTMFRAYRNDIGVYRDARDKGTVNGGSLGLEIVKHFGGEASYTNGETYTGQWETNNNASGHYAFKTPANSENEAWYFKSYGELTATPKGTYDNIGYDQPRRLQVVDDGPNDNLNVYLEDKYGAWNTTTPSNQYNATGRAKRNTAIQYVDSDNPKKGIYTIAPDGSMYVYGKAQLVNNSVECIFSIDGNGKTIADTRLQNYGQKNSTTPDYDVKNGISDKFFSRKTLTQPYPYSYLITEIKGADYIDANNDGVANDGDKGYWVKFIYEEITSAQNPYKYRNPFVGANYLRGKNTTPADDKAQYIYGEKTICYLSSIETNSHIAEFNRSDRNDGIGANNQLNTGSKSATLGQLKQQKLDYITLKSKSNLTVPLLKVNFQYSYALCKNVDNNDNGQTLGTNEGGKLTLKKVWVEYEKSKRGKMNAYQFDYDENTIASNPDYAVNSYDRWGYYYDRTLLPSPNETMTVSGTPCDIPYMPQMPNKRAQLDQYAGAWSLRAITLPSGAKISVTYEADDYGYVQDRRAMQMFPIASIGYAVTASNPANGHIDNSISPHRKIYFKLEEPIPTSRIDANAYFKARYIGSMTSVYFRNYAHLVRSDDPRMDYVGGYAPLDESGIIDSDGNGDYDQGYVKLGDMKIGSKTFSDHPFCIANWQALMTDYSELAYTGKIDADPNSSKSTKIAEVKNVFSHFSRLTAVFTGFYGKCKSKNWGTTIDINRSYIRLQSPDYAKVGGGVRVKKIVLSDQWDKMQTGAKASSYGQYYDYTLTKDNGETISSGVATYEPAIGGDENPFRTIKQYAKKVPLKLAINLCFEENINESYFPAPSVGYSRVTVKSLATYANEHTTETTEVPNGIMSNGATRSEFYTCRDFPVITGETNIDINPEKTWIPIPLIGSYLSMTLFATQGYSIELNDMHGKLKKISTYEQSKSGTIDYDKPVTYVEYEYFAAKTSDANKNSYKLTNAVPLLIRNASGNIVKSNQYTLGEQIEFFTDMREEHANETTGGVSFNLDLVTVPPPIVQFPFPSIWPSFEHSENRIRVAVTNKVVHRFAILKSVTSYNNGSTVIMNNLVFDGQTGQPVLTSVTNNFDDPVYTYNVPAHLMYDGMGAASKTVGLNFKLKVVSSSKTGEIKCSGSFAGVENNPQLLTLLQQGDIISYLSGGVERFATISKIENGYVYVHSDNVYLTGAFTTCTLIKPGRKNILGASVGSVTTLGSSVAGYNISPVDQLYITE